MVCESMCTFPRTYLMHCLCLVARFQSCHGVAIQALHALKMRAEYELLTNAIQV